jgi:hypothetical protein
VICSPNFRTAGVGNVSGAIKYKVKAAYGLLPRNYAQALEIDHIVPLAIGGSNAIANLFPENGTHTRATKPRTGSSSGCTSWSVAGR